MKLPANYIDIVTAGAATLRGLGARIRSDAARRPDAPELWLSVRDYEGLAGRLADSDKWAWQQGFVGHWIAPQDLAVLDELLSAEFSPIELLAADQIALARLRDFVGHYCNRDFELDGPAVGPSTDSS